MQCVRSAMLIFRRRQAALPEVHDEVSENLDVETLKPAHLPPRNWTEYSRRLVSAGLPKPRRRPVQLDVQRARGGVRAKRRQGEGI